MRTLVGKYAGKLLRDRSAQPGRIGIAAADDAVIEAGAADLSGLAAGVLSRLSCLGVVAAAPSLPFADFLVRRAPADASRLVPARHGDAHLPPRHPVFAARGDRRRPRGGRRRAARETEGGDPRGDGHRGRGPGDAGAGLRQLLLRVPRNVRAIPGGRAAGRLPAPRGGGSVPSLPGRSCLPPLSADGLAFRTGPLEDPDEIRDEIRNGGEIRRRAGAGGFLLRQHLLQGGRHDPHLPDGRVARRAGGMHRPGPGRRQLHGGDHRLQRAVRPPRDLRGHRRPRDPPRAPEVRRRDEHALRRKGLRRSRTAGGIAPACGCWGTRRSSRGRSAPGGWRPASRRSSALPARPSSTGTACSPWGGTGSRRRSARWRRWRTGAADEYFRRIDKRPGRGQSKSE